MSEKYKYLVDFKIEVKRTDNQMLTDDENSMVQKMREATHTAITKVMTDYGQNNVKRLIDETVIY